MPQYFSASRGARTAPDTRSPMRRPKRRTWLELTYTSSGAGQQAVAAHEAEALVDDVEDAGGVVVAGALGLALQDQVDEHVLALALVGFDLEVAWRPGGAR